MWEEVDDEALADLFISTLTSSECTRFLDKFQQYRHNVCRAPATKIAPSPLLGEGREALALHKRFNITEQVNMQFRGEAFNIFNHANFALPNPLVFSGTSYNSSAGSITATSNASRQIQFALKLLF